jgi:uncharacterized membrane protein (DUF441 family)
MSGAMVALRPFVSRIAAALVALLITWLAAKGINLDQDTQSNLKLLVETTIYIVVYAISHRLVDKQINPGDAAGSHLAMAEKAESTALKAQDV